MSRKSTKKLNTNDLPIIVHNLQERYRRHLTRYPQIAKHGRGELTVATIYRFTQAPPSAMQWRFGTLFKLERAINAYEKALVEELTNGG